MEFKATRDNGLLQVKAVVEKVGNDVIVHIPSFKIIEQLKREQGEGENRKRNIREVSSKLNEQRG